MIPNPSIDNLAERIRQRCGSDGHGPYILFLGEGCAIAAGAPSRVAIARQALRTFTPPPGGLKPPPAESDEPDDSVFERFAKLTEQLSPASLARMLRTAYTQVAVPSFYQYLAMLVRERYFPLIMTTNFDTLLEQALANAGARSSEYWVTTISSQRLNLKPRGYEQRDSEPLTHIVKLHGDLAQGIAQITPDQIEEALNASRSWIKSDLKGDMIMVEHILSDDPIDRWLSYSPQRELWWIAEYPPADPMKLSSWVADGAEQILEDMGRPQVFFPQLALRLLHTPFLCEQNDSRRAISPDIVSDITTIQPQAQPSDPLAETLYNEILRNQSALYNLEQEGVSGERSPQVEVQIAYHKRQSFHLEDKLRSLPDIRSRVVDCVKRIGDRIRDQGPSALSDPASVESMVKFIDGQVSTLETEFKKDSPNQIVVSASLGATLTLADRLATEYGESVVNPADVKDLASLVPTVAGKVVL
jgi:hypothetical protein